MHQVRLFGPYADATGRAELALSGVRDPCTAGDILDALTERHAELAPLMAGVRLAVNQVLVDRAHPVRGGDELALIGMVGGG